MLSLGRQRIVQRGGDQYLDHRFAAPAVAARVLPGSVHIAEARRQNDSGGVMVGAIASRQRREARQLRERDVDAEGCGGATPCAHAAKKDRLERARRDHRGIKKLGIDVGGDRRGADHLAVPEHHAGGPALLDQDLANGGLGRDVHAMRCGRARHRLRDRAHAPDRVPPESLFAVHLTESVMQENVGATGRVRASVISDDGVEAEPGLHQFALEPAVEIIASRFRNEIE